MHGSVIFPYTFTLSFSAHVLGSVQLPIGLPHNGQNSLQMNDLKHSSLNNDNLAAEGHTISCRQPCGIRSLNPRKDKWLSCIPGNVSEHRGQSRSEEGKGGGPGRIHRGTGSGFTGTIVFVGVGFRIRSLE